MAQPPLRDPFAEPSSSSPSSASSSSRGGPSLSLGAPRSHRRRGGAPEAATTAPTTTPTGLQLRKRYEDDAIRATDNDALTSRLSSIQAGYLAKDDYSPLFAASTAPAIDPNLPLNPAPTLRRPPVINVGTYLRCSGIDALVEAFLTHAGSEKKQIVSLGAGSDGRYWRLMSDSRLSDQISHYLEADHPEVVTRKISAIERHSSLRAALYGDVRVKEKSTSQGPPSSGPSLLSEKYSIYGLDLRQEAPLREMIGTLDPSQPTIVLSECVLSYISAKDTDTVLSVISKRLDQTTPLAAISYEMCVAGENGPSPLQEGQQIGRFGQVMLSNLETRGLSLHGARAYTTPRSHEARFTDSLRRHHGGDGGDDSNGSSNSDSNSGSKNDDFAIASDSRSLSRVWTHSLSERERQRLTKIEGLDEVEELQLLLGCYALAWACRQPATARTTTTTTTTTTTMTGTERSDLPDKLRTALHTLGLDR